MEFQKINHFKPQCAQSGFDPPNFKSYRDPVFQVRMGCGNHPLCSVFSNSVPPSIDFFKKRFWSLINCRKLAINPKLLMWKKVNMGGWNWRKLSIGGDSHNPSWPEKRGLYNSWNLRGQNHSEHTVTRYLSRNNRDYTLENRDYPICIKPNWDIGGEFKSAGCNEWNISNEISV